MNVTARQFDWTFAYPGKGDMTSAQLRLPLGRTVEAPPAALDVIHSFWVPEFGQKQDAVPGQDTSLVITPTRSGRTRDLHRALRPRPRADADCARS